MSSTSASPSRCDDQATKVSHLHPTSDASWRTWSSAQSSPTKIIDHHTPSSSSVRPSINPFRGRGHPAATKWISAHLARHPISATGDLTNRPGHDLSVGINTHPTWAECSLTGGSVISLSPTGPKPRQRRVDRLPLAGHFGTWSGHLQFRSTGCPPCSGTGPNCARHVGVADPEGPGRRKLS
jgi:hypothetical protein